MDVYASLFAEVFERQHETGDIYKRQKPKSYFPGEMALDRLADQ